ncbi:unnamed protein product, partial [Brassica rapa subsp. trilocularis]
ILCFFFYTPSIYRIFSVAALVEYSNADDVFVLSKGLNLRVRGSLQSLLNMATISQ